ncbi:MAG: DUF1569 domain-containing protein [Pseudomonadales bacterium]
MAFIVYIVTFDELRQNNALQEVTMKRRQLLKMSAVGGTVLGLGSYAWLQRGTSAENFTIDAALAQLDILSVGAVTSVGGWNPYQIFVHCAQSVEYSMTGFPEHKSKFFKNTAGQLAFSVFSSRGKMSHPLTDPIPGAPAFDLKQDTHGALTRLRKALLEFQQHKGDLEPHFAYGELSKEDYAVAHVIHLNNHLEEIVV